jgi:hypothetical protein
MLQSARGHPLLMAAACFQQQWVISRSYSTCPARVAPSLTMLHGSAAACCRCLPADVEAQLCKEPLDRLMQSVIAVRTVVIDEFLHAWCKEEGFKQVRLLGGLTCGAAASIWWWWW